MEIDSEKSRQGWDSNAQRRGIGINREAVIDGRERSTDGEGER